MTDLMKFIFGMIFLSSVVGCSTPAHSSGTERTQPPTWLQSLTEASKAAQIKATSTVIANSINGGTALSISQKEKTEDDIFEYYLATQRECTTALLNLEAKRSGHMNLRTKVNAVGALITLIGGVTVYAPAKAVLMGIGISSSGGADSVLGGIATNQNDGITLSEEHIRSLRTDYTAAIKAYQAIEKSGDVRGAKRLDALTFAAAGCSGLTLIEKG